MTYSTLKSKLDSRLSFDFKLPPFHFNDIELTVNFEEEDQMALLQTLKLFVVLLQIMKVRAHCVLSWVVWVENRPLNDKAPN